MATTKKAGSEEDVRVKLLNSFMTCSHRDTDKITEVHKEVQEKDPLFYAHLACWYRKNGDLRDHNEVFISLLSTDLYLPNREVGLALFRELPVFMKRRVLGFIKGKKVKIREKTGKKIKVGKKSVDEVKITEKMVGLKKSLPSSFRTDVTKYLRWLESHPEKFDAVAMRNGKDLKALYASYGIQVKACERAKKILFDKEYPADSKLNVFKQISEAKTPEEAAKLIVQNKIPYTVAVGLVEKVTPTVLVALINAMTPQELINNIASLQEKGAMDNPEVKKLIQAKLEKAKTSKSVSALKSKTAKATGRVTDEAISKQLDEVADVQVKKSGVISVPTAIFVDRSGSMNIAIEVGKKCAALVSGVSVTDLHVVAFNNTPVEVVSQGRTLTDWEKAFAPIHSDGGTSIGCALDLLLRRKTLVEQIIVITDEGENAAPFFHDVYKRYTETMKVTPHVVVINVTDAGRGADHTFTDFLKNAKITFDVYKPEKSDYYGLPGLVTLLSRKSKYDLVMEIMEVPLLQRKDFR